MIIAVRHNIEVAHRLFETEGKCTQIHGHSMKVTLGLAGQMGVDGMAYSPWNPPGKEGDMFQPERLEFGGIKKRFREYLDTWYDHRLLLNASDPWAKPIFFIQEADNLSGEGEELYRATLSQEQHFLPGLNACPGDPTTENISLWIRNWATKEGLPVDFVEVWETKTNCVRV